MSDALAMVSREGSTPEMGVLQISGKLSSDSVPEFLKTLRAQSCKTLLLDMGEMSYVDSSGVGALVQQFSAMKKQGRSLVLVRPHSRVVAVLQITKVLSLFPRFESIEAAEAQMK